MDARSLRIVVVLSVLNSLGAVYRTPNFTVNAPTPEIAEQVGKLAEHFRVELAREWIGRTLPKWYKPCSVTVNVGQMGAGGATTFAFDRGEVFGWRMNLQGPLDRILDSVLPHEVSHTIFACHFRRPLPRWADEGAATLAEDESEKRRQRLMFDQILGEKRRIPLRKLLAIKEYPEDMQSVLTLYAEGYSLADFLVETGGKSRYLEFLNVAHEHGWDHATKKLYGMDDVDRLDEKWNRWIIAGSPRLNLPDGQMLASAESEEMEPASTQSPAGDTIIRSQTPDEVPPNPNSNLAGRQPLPRPQHLTPPDLRRPSHRQPAPTPRTRPSATNPARERAARDGWNAVGVEASHLEEPPFADDVLDGRVLRR